MSKLKVYLIRIYDHETEDKIVAERCEKAENPREACRLAFGVIYDRPEDTARYLMLEKMPRSYSGVALKRITDIRQNWHPIPRA